MIFKGVGDGRPYPDHGHDTPAQWAEIPPTQVRLDDLVTTKRTLDLDALLSDDSTFYGDLFAHVVQHKGVMYLEDGLHRAVRAALQQRAVLHARVLVVPDDAAPVTPAAPSSGGGAARRAPSPATPALPPDDAPDDAPDDDVPDVTATDDPTTPPRTTL